MSTGHTILLFDDSTIAPQWWINYMWNSSDDFFSGDRGIMVQHLAQHGCKFVLVGSQRLLMFDSAESRMTFIMRHVET